MSPFEKRILTLSRFRRRRHGGWHGTLWWCGDPVLHADNRGHGKPTTLTVGDSYADEFKRLLRYAERAQQQLLPLSEFRDPADALLRVVDQLADNASVLLTCRLCRNSGRSRACYQVTPEAARYGKAYRFFNLRTIFGKFSMEHQMDAVEGLPEFVRYLHGESVDSIALHLGLREDLVNPLTTTVRLNKHRAWTHKKKTRAHK